MALKIDLRVPGCAPASEVASFIRECEDAGFDGVGILDSQLLERDVFVVMAVAAQATSRIRLASAVTNPVTRHVSVLASAAKSVADAGCCSIIANGRQANVLTRIMNGEDVGTIILASGL